MLDGLRTGIGRLISAYEKEKETREILEERVVRYESEIEDLRKQITELKRQIDNLKVKEAFLSASENRAEAKEKVSKLIRDIDRCISMLE